MASFDGSAFDPLAFAGTAFDLEDTPGALYGTAAGSSTATAAPTAIAWLGGSAAGTSTAQAYLELDGVPPAPTEPPVIGISISGGTVFRQRPKPKRAHEETEALMLLELI